MNDRVLHLRLTIFLVVTVFTAIGVFAQAPPPANYTTLHVSGLTASMRDELSQDLRRDGTFKIAFACVPAGILILEPVDMNRRAEQQRTLMPMVHRRIGAERIDLVTMDRNAAEARCAETRNQ